MYLDLILCTSEEMEFDLTIFPYVVCHLKLQLRLTDIAYNYYWEWKDVTGELKRWASSRVKDFSTFSPRAGRWPFQLLDILSEAPAALENWTR